MIWLCVVNFFFQAEDGIRDSDMWLEFRRVLFRSYAKYSETHLTDCQAIVLDSSSIFTYCDEFIVKFPQKPCELR